jgi:hypothetical protein
MLTSHRPNPPFIKLHFEFELALHCRHYTFALCTSRRINGRDADQIHGGGQSEKMRRSTRPHGFHKAVLAFASNRTSDCLKAHIVHPSGSQ